MYKRKKDSKRNDELERYLLETNQYIAMLKNNLIEKILAFQKNKNEKKLMH